jgi:short-subunit dehydrogenase
LAVVTGASSGLGSIFAQRLSERGFNLALSGRDPDRLEETRRRVSKTRDCVVTTVAVDLGTERGVASLVHELGDRPIDLLVNNAGFGTYGPFDQSSVERPGPTRTGFVDALQNAAASETSAYSKLADPALVVDAGLRALDRGQPVVVPGLRNRAVAFMPRLAPRRLVTSVSARVLTPSTSR